MSDEDVVPNSPFGNKSRLVWGDDVRQQRLETHSKDLRYNFIMSGAECDRSEVCYLSWRGDLFNQANMRFILPRVKLTNFEELADVLINVITHNVPIRVVCGKSIRARSFIGVNSKDSSFHFLFVWDQGKLDIIIIRDARV